MSRSRNNVGPLFWLLGAMFVALAVCLPVRADEKPQQHADRIEKYLSRLGLDELRIRHLERTLRQASDASDRARQAQRLADVYVERLLTSADSPEQFTRLEQQVRRLIADVPEVDSAELRILLLQAEYQQTEAALLAWLQRDEPAPLPSDIAPILARLANQFSERQKAISADAEALSLKLDDDLPRSNRSDIEKQLLQKQSLVSRAQFFAGWSNYYLGVTRRMSGGGEPTFPEAQEAFLDLLGVFDEKEYAGIAADSLGLESVWRSRAAIGLGLTEIALDRLAAAERCFAWLGHGSVPLALRDQGPYWHLQGLLNADKTAAAIELAEQQISTFAPGQSSAKTSFCVLLVKAGFGKRAVTEGAARLGELGILGLARLRQFDALSTLATQYSIAAATPQTKFYLDWLEARRKFTAAEKSKSTDDYRAALKLFTTSLTSPESQNDLAIAGRCRLGMAWCHFRLDDLEAAARMFHEVVPLLRAEAPDDALQAAWMESVCYYQLAGQDKRFAAAAETALNVVIRDFPQASQAARAQWLLEKLNPELATPQEKIRRLAAIPPADTRYADAQFELCELHHRQWRENKGKAAAIDHATKATAAAERFVEATGSGDAQRRLRVVLLAIETLAPGTSQHAAKIENLLQLGTAATQSLPEKNSGVAELHFRQLQFAQQQGNSAAVATEAQWIATHARGTPFELPALMVVAQQADRTVAAAVKDKSPSAELDKHYAAAAEHYQRLVELLGDSPETIQSRKNALAASSRLAYYLERQKNWPAAAARLEPIVAAFPDDRNYLRRLARAQMESGSPGESLVHWRKLLAGLSRGSDPWLEAKYYQITCLRQTDPAEAAQVWKQFRLLYPEVKSPVWAEKFTALANDFAR